MTPTLAGRVQTRIFLLIVIGVPWTLLVGLILPRPDGASLGDLYRVLLTAIAVVILVGLVWEVIYHALQQLRWEKDWPTLYGLITVVNEGIATYLILTRALPDDLDLGFASVNLAEIPVATFVIHFVTTWLLVWLVANGPMRLFFIRWRFQGGRIA